MTADYALVHLYWTIPLAAVLSLIYWPLRASVDAYRIGLLLAIAVVYTIPWDSYLIRAAVWSYPPSAVLGPKFWQIPIEELFFFVAQTYITSLVYLIVSKPLLHIVYLPSSADLVDGTKGLARQRKTGTAISASGIFLGAYLVFSLGAKVTYLGLILLWCCPVILFLWSIASAHILSIPRHVLLTPIILPTAFLWLLDTLALHRGTWVIHSETKTGISLWMNFDLEEALFFVMTNVLVTFGQIAFDQCWAIIQIRHYATLSPTSSSPPLSLSHLSTWVSIQRCLFLPRDEMYDTEAIRQLREAQRVLQGKSRSFSIASSVFEGALRVDLIRLYAFCRVIDDIVDAESPVEPGYDVESVKADTLARVEIIRTWLNCAFSAEPSVLQTYEAKGSPDALLAPLRLSPDAQSAFNGLPRYPEFRKPLLEMLEGFEMDCAFGASSEKKVHGPIKVAADLIRYSQCVAGTVAEMCCTLAYRHSSASSGAPRDVVDSAIQMGVALQLVNIARDVEVDARLVKRPGDDGPPRTYIPLSWRQEYANRTSVTNKGVSWPDEGKAAPIVALTAAEILTHRSRLLNLAFVMYGGARRSMDSLPTEGGARRGIKTAVESYMQIGRELRLAEKKGVRAGAQMGRASVPRWKRVAVLWWTLARN